MSVCVWVGGGMALWLMCACAWGVICVRVGYVARGVGISSYDPKRASDLGFQEPRTSLRLCARTQQVCVRARAPLQHCLFPSPSFPSISVLPIFCPTLTRTQTSHTLPYGLSRLSSNTRQPVVTAADKSCARVRRQSTVRTAAS